MVVTGFFSILQEASQQAW